MWHWLTHTDAGLAMRIVAGLIVFALLALVDLRRNGAAARRWREYTFLLACVIAAMLYGIVNDTVTSSISWEYFCYGKGLWPEVIRNLPPDPIKLHLMAAVVGMKATWTAGLIIGVAMLLANNPRPGIPQLPAPSLLRLLLLVAAIAATTAALVGAIGYFGGLTWISHDFSEMIRRDEMRPRRFIAVFGIHLGDYIGGLVGIGVSVVKIGTQRHRESPPPNKPADYGRVISTRGIADTRP